MPKSRVFINSFHYWILFALLNSIELFMLPKKEIFSNGKIIALLAFWLACELCNLKCHLILSSFRKKNKTNSTETNYESTSQKRGIPYGCGFDLVSCANYFWECLGWLGFSVLTKNKTGYLFTLVSFLQMLQWALKKHSQYKK